MTTPDSGSNLTPPPPIPAGGSPVQALNDRAREILRHIVETYVGSGEAVGSRTLSRMGDVDLSPATIRNVMADLEDAGLLYARHTSAGRLPTDAGLRMFVDGLLEVGRLSEDERERIEAQCAANGRSVEQVLRQASQSLAGLSEQVGLVVAPQSESALQHIEFRQPWPRPRAGGHGAAQRRYREPDHRRAGRYAQFRAGRGVELSDRPADRQDPGRGARGGDRGTGRVTGRNSMRLPAISSSAAWRSGRVRRPRRPARVR